MVSAGSPHHVCPDGFSMVEKQSFIAAKRAKEQKAVYVERISADFKKYYKGQMANKKIVCADHEKYPDIHYCALCEENQKDK